ncbi:MAG: hypothetical protein H6619_03235 [Deltaproteobacteria bacterium]|nr:hypothetical protein [Deltaproteobacteria bacterium]
MRSSSSFVLFNLLLCFLSINAAIAGDRTLLVGANSAIQNINPLPSSEILSGETVAVSYEPNSCDFKSSVLSVSTPVYRTLIPLSIVYNSAAPAGEYGRGVNLLLPHISDLDDQFGTYFNGTENLKLMFDDETDEFFTKYNDRFQILSGTLNEYVQLLSDGTKIYFSHQSNSNMPGETTRWKISSIKDKYGWETNYYYESSGNTEFLSLVKVDCYNDSTCSNPRFIIDLSAENGLVADISVRNDTESIQRYSFSYADGADSTKLLRKIKHFGENDELISTKTLAYSKSGSFKDLLTKITYPLGGTETITYEATDLVDLSTGEILSKATPRLIVSNNLLGNVKVTSLSCEEGAIAGERFLGFKHLKTALPNGIDVSTEFHFVDSHESLLGLPYHIVKYNSEGELLSQVYNKYDYVEFTDGAYRVAPTSQASIDYSESLHTVVTGWRSTFDFENYRVDEFKSYGRATSFNPDTWIIFDEESLDNKIARYQYTPDNSILNLRNRISNITVVNDIGDKINEHRFEYDSLGGLHKKNEWVNTDDTYKVTQITYNSNGTLHEIVNSAGLKRVYSYDSNDTQITIVDDPGGLERTTVTYLDQVTRLIKERLSPGGVTTKIDRDASYRIKKVSLVNGEDVKELESKNYQFLGIDNQKTNNSISVVGDFLSEVLYLDGFGTVIQSRQLFDKETDQYKTTDIIFDSSGIKRISNPYLSTGILYTSPKASTGVGVEIHRDSAGRLKKIQPDLVGNGVGAYSYEYELDGNPSALVISDPLSNRIEMTTTGVVSEESVGNGSEKITWTTVADASNLLTWSLDSEHNNFISEQNSIGNSTQENFPAMSSQTYSYYDNGRLSAIEDDLNRKTKLYYDSLGRISVVEKGAQSIAGELISYVWGSSYQPDFNTPQGTIGVIDGPLDRVEFSYDSFGAYDKMLHTDKENFESYLVDLKKDEEGRLSSITFPNNVVINYNYDENGYLKSVSSPDFSSDIPLYSVKERDLNGNIVKYNWGNGLSEVFTYYGNSGMKKTQELRSPYGDLLYRAEYDYDELNMTRVVESNSWSSRETLYQYNSRGNLTTVIEDGNEFLIERDNLGRVIHHDLDAPGVDVYKYENTADPYLPTSFNKGSDSYTLNYDESKNLTRFQSPHVGETHDLYYNAAGELVGISYLDGSGLGIGKGVLGDNFKISSLSSSKTRTIKSFFSGLFQIVEEDNTSFSLINVPGEKPDGSFGTVVTLRYDDYLMLASTGGGDDTPLAGGGSGSGSTTSEPKKEKKEDDTGTPKKPKKPKPVDLPNDVDPCEDMEATSASFHSSVGTRDCPEVQDDELPAPHTNPSLPYSNSIYGTDVWVNGEDQKGIMRGSSPCGYLICSDLGYCHFTSEHSEERQEFWRNYRPKPKQMVYGSISAAPRPGIIDSYAAELEFIAMTDGPLGVATEVLADFTGLNGYDQLLQSYQQDGLTVSNAAAGAFTVVTAAKGPAITKFLGTKAKGIIAPVTNKVSTVTEPVRNFCSNLYNRIFRRTGAGSGSLSSHADDLIPTPNTKNVEEIDLLERAMDEVGDAVEWGTSYRDPKTGRLIPAGDPRHPEWGSLDADGVFDTEIMDELMDLNPFPKHEPGVDPGDMWKFGG